MRLQVQVLPLQDRRYASKASLPSITQNQQHANLPQGALSFLEICDDNITLDELCSKLCARFARIYPHKPPLNIKKLQDVYGNDLDLIYTVGDVFDDKSADQQNSVVRVLQAPTTRDSSVPPQSALRPHIHGFAGQKRTRGSLGTLRENPTIGGGEGRTPEPRAGRASKRQRLQELVGDGEDEADPDRPIPSKELNPGDMTCLVQRTGNELGADQERSPGPIIGNSQPSHLGHSQTHTPGVNSHRFGKLDHQMLSDTLTVPESPTHQGRLQPINNQLSQANGLASAPQEESAKSESVDDNNGLLHSIPRSSIGSPFLEGEGIIRENLATASQGLLPSLSTLMAQNFQGNEPSGRPQSIITPSSAPKTSTHTVARSSSKLKRPNPSMFKSSSRSTGSSEENSNVYDAIETDEDGSPGLPPPGPRPAKRVKRQNSFPIMNGQSLMSNILNGGKPKRSPGAGGAVAKRRDSKPISASEVKWLRDHEGFHSQSCNRESQRNSDDGSGSHHVLIKGDKESKERSAKERIRGEARLKAVEEGWKATAETERERPEREAKANSQRTLEQIRQQKQRETMENQRRADERVAQEAEESRHIMEEDRRVREANEKRQKEADNEKPKEEENRAKEVKDKEEAARLEGIKREEEKRLEDERQNQERKERAQRLAQTKALKTEKAEKEAEARRLAKKNEERIAREALGKAEKAEKEAEARRLTKKNEERTAKDIVGKAEKAEKEAEAGMLAKKNEERTHREALGKAEKAEKETEAGRLAKKNERTAGDTVGKAEKAEKETGARRPARKKEKSAGETAEKKRLEEEARQRAQEVEEARPGEKGMRAERLTSAPSTEPASNSKARERRRLSTTPLIPRPVIPKDSLVNGYGSGSVPKAPVRDAGPDPQMSLSLEQGAPMRRSVSFHVDETPQSVSKPPSSTPIPADLTPAPTPATGPSQMPRKETKVYPPGMGPDNLKSFMPVSAEKPVAAAPKPKGKSPAASTRAPNVKTQANSRLKQSINKKVTDAKSARNPAPKPAPKPTPTIQEIVISSGDSDSGSSYHSDPDSDNENIAVSTTAKPTTVSAPAPSTSTAKSDDEDGVSSQSSTTSSRSQSRLYSRSPSGAPPHLSPPTHSPVRYLDKTPSESSGSDSVSASRSESSSTSRSASSSPIPSRSRSDSIGEANSDDQDTEDDVSTSLQSSSRSSPHAGEKINGDHEDAISDVSSGSKEVVNRLNSTLQQSAQRSAETRGRKPSNMRSPVAGSSSQAKPSLNSFPSLSQLGSQSFDHTTRDHKDTTGSQKSLSRSGSQGGVKSMPPASLGSSSDDSSSDGDSDDNSGVPQNRRAGDSEPNSKVARGLKGLISGMWTWRSSQGITD